MSPCVPLCGLGGLRSRGLPAEPIKTAVTAEIEANPKIAPPIISSADILASEPEAVTISESKNPEHSASTTDKELSSSEEKTPVPKSTQKTKSLKPSSSPTEPRMGDTRVVNGEKQIYILGFGWIKDEGGGSGTTVGSPGNELTGNKVGQVGGGTRVDGKGDINKMVGIMGTGDAPVQEKHKPVPGSKTVIDGKPYIWVPGFGWIEDNGRGSTGTVAKDMYENDHKIGIMGGSESPPREAAAPLVPEQPEPVEGEIHIVLVEVPEKNSTTPSYKPDTKSP